jgi:hypothetical protein
MESDRMSPATPSVRAEQGRRACGLPVGQIRTARRERMRARPFVSPVLLFTTKRHASCLRFVLPPEQPSYDGPRTRAQARTSRGPLNWIASGEIVLALTRGEKEVHPCGVQ